MKYFFIICIGLIGLLVVSLFELGKGEDGRLHVIFCDVGQGDSILIKTPSGKLVLYDGGPDESVLNCLSDNIPFWQRSIGIFTLSHPHNDHFMGMFSVFPNYTVKTYVGETLVNRSLSYREFESAVKNEVSQAHLMKQGGNIDLGDGVKLSVLGPSDAFIKQTSPGGTISETGEFASLVVLVTYGAFSAILTGDSQVSGLVDANPPNISVLHVPHHGSKYGLDANIVQKMDPEVAVISVGENNYGHPTKEVIDLLKIYGSKIFRTDRDGEVEIVTDGKTYTIN